MEKRLAHRSSSADRRLIARAVVLAGVVGMGWLAGPGPAGAAEGDPSSGRLPAQTEESTLSWSVRPTPTESDPDRPNFGYDIEPGANVTDSIRVRNYSDEPLELDVYASDAITTSTGALDLLPAGEQPTDVGAWITLEESELDVPAQDFVDIPFTLTVPADAEPGDHTGGIVTSHRTPGVDGQGQAVVLDRRLGSRVHVRVDGPLRPRLEISDVDVSYTGTLNPIGTGDLHVVYTVTNAGNVRLGAEQVVTSQGRFGFPGRTATPESMGELLPGNSLTFAVDVEDVWPTGRTTATIELTPVPTRDGDVFERDTPVATASATTPTIPWTLLAALVVLVATALLWRWSRRRRERREAALVESAVQAALATEAASSDTTDAGHSDASADGISSQSESLSDTATDTDERKEAQADRL